MEIDEAQLKRDLQDARAGLLYFRGRPGPFSLGLRSSCTFRTVEGNGTSGMNGVKDTNNLLGRHRAQARQILRKFSMDP